MTLATLLRAAGDSSTLGRLLRLMAVSVREGTNAGVFTLLDAKLARRRRG